MVVNMEKITQNEIEQMVSFISNINQKESNREVVASNLAKIQNYIDLIDAQDQATKEILVIETARKKLVILRRQLQANYSFSRAESSLRFSATMEKKNVCYVKVIANHELYYYF